MRSQGIGTAVVLVAAFISGFSLASCGGGDEAMPTTTTETGTTTTTTTETTITETEPPGPIVVEVVVEGAAPKGGIVRETVKQGEQVVLTVRSDVADEVHLHGYDLSRDVAAGGTARIGFRAKIPGRFEVELERRGVQIALLTVEP